MESPSRLTREDIEIDRAVEEDQFRRCHMPEWMAVHYSVVQYEADEYYVPSDEPGRDTPGRRSNVGLGD